MLVGRAVAIAWGNPKRQALRKAGQGITALLLTL